MPSPSQQPIPPQSTAAALASPQLAPAQVVAVQPGSASLAAAAPRPPATQGPPPPGWPLTLAVIELEVDVDRAQLIATEEPAGAAVPAVVLRMPPYIAGALAQVLDRWALMCQVTGSVEMTEWVGAAHALLMAGREAAGGERYPELEDLHHPLPAGGPRRRAAGGGRA